MKFYYYSHSETFVVLAADQFVGAMMACLNNRGRISTFVEKIATLEQKFSFQIGTLNPHGINERFSFH